MASIIGTSIGFIVPATVGAAAATATILLLQPQSLQTIETRVEHETVREIVAKPDDTRLDRIEHELQVLRQNAAQSVVANAQEPAVPEDVSQPPDPEQEYAEQQQMKEDWLAQHALEATDVNWAYDAEQAIDLDLDRLKQAQWAGRDPMDFQVMGVNCRSNLCVVELGWNSVQTAVENGAYLAMHDYAQNCNVTVFGPAPEDIEANEPFVQELLFDCADFRATL